MTEEHDIILIFRDEIKRRLIDESFPRIKQCLEVLTDEEIWHRPNDHTVSIGNLVLHLNGNVRQWVLSTIGLQQDTRKRQMEFDETGPVDRQIILADLDGTLDEVNMILGNLDREALTKTYNVQGFKENGIGILVHVTEHFSYHVGQITYATKSLKNMDMGYYKGQDLDVTS